METMMLCLQWAGHGVAMKNALESLKQMADEVLDWTNAEDGVISKLQEMEQREQLDFTKKFRLSKLNKFSLSKLNKFSLSKLNKFSLSKLNSRDIADVNQDAKSNICGARVMKSKATTTTTIGLPAQFCLPNVGILG